MRYGDGTTLPRSVARWISRCGKNTNGAALEPASSKKATGDFVGCGVVRPAPGNLMKLIYIMTSRCSVVGKATPKRVAMLIRLRKSTLDKSHDHPTTDHLSGSLASLAVRWQEANAMPTVYVSYYVARSVK